MTAVVRSAAALRRALVDVVLTLGATLGLVQAYALPVRWNRGPEGRWWEPIRLAASRALGVAFDERSGPRPITEGEYAGRLPCSLAAAERRLWAEGFVRNPFARLKHRDGEPERGSWAYRESPLADRQLHLMLFPADGGVDVYAHEELSCVNPRLGAAHVDGVGQSVARGVERARARLPLETGAAPTSPPDGPWALGRPADRPAERRPKRSAD